MRYYLTRGGVHRVVPSDEELMVRTWLVVLALALPHSVVSAQQPLFTSGIDLVRVGVTVVDGDEQLVTDLAVEDLELFEDGRRQEIRYFSRGLASDVKTVPLHLGLLLDTSGSMGGDAALVKTAVIKFLNTITYAEDVALVDFDTDVRVGRYGQADFLRLVERIRGRHSAGMTALYDALGVYLDGAFEQDGRKVLLLYTDGDDTRSRMPLTDTMDLIKASDVTIYVVGFQKNLRSSVRVTRRRRLEQLAALTGGRCYFPASVDALDDIYAQIAAELRARYSLGYVSTNGRPDGTWRQIEVKVRSSRTDLRRVKVRNRQGYFAPYDAALDR